MEDGLLEESQKAEIVNTVYLNRILEVIEDAISLKKIDEPQGRIIQFSDGKDSVNIYNKGNCYIVNLDGTNFSSLIGAKDGAYLYKNKILDIEYKLAEVSLPEGVVKRTISYKLKDLKGLDVFLADEDALSLIYMETSSDNTPKCVMYNENLVNLSVEELAKKIKQENQDLNKEDAETVQNEKGDKTQTNTENSNFSELEAEKEDKAQSNTENSSFSENKDEKNGELHSNMEDSSFSEYEDELPSNIEDFDFSKYEKKAMEQEEFLEDEEEFEEDSYQSEEEAYEEGEESIFGKIFEMEYEEESEQYRNIRCFSEDDELEGEEKILFAQQAEDELITEEEEFSDISDIILEIVAAYENGLNRFRPEVSTEKSKFSQKQQAEKESTDGQEK